MLLEWGGLCPGWAVGGDVVVWQWLMPCGARHTQDSQGAPGLTFSTR